ncbi:hypothetical protein [Erythrobacter sp. SG61-1L]|uniref:hypothetical protein n=1 Tax=Erythrobacter sp. SG61-1L TaxID=1603897 RepID=UPI0019D6FA86|nr:hypothetical protein [Erythrobacter sp. SG61-1L]
MAESSLGAGAQRAFYNFVIAKGEALWRSMAQCDPPWIAARPAAARNDYTSIRRTAG